MEYVDALFPVIDTPKKLGPNQPIAQKEVSLLGKPGIVEIGSPVVRSSRE
jgi:hypothetical protein